MPETDDGWIVVQVAELCVVNTGMAPSLDVGAALTAAEALGADMTAVVELLPYARAGLMSGLAKRKDVKGKNG